MNRQSGLSIPEVLFALMILMTASTATMAAVGNTKRTISGTEQSKEATRIAQSTLDDMKGLEYSQLGLPNNLNDSQIPPLAADEDRFPDLQNLQVGNGSNMVVEELVQPNTGGSLNDGNGAPGQIDPGPEVVAVNGGNGPGRSFLVYRYVTWKSVNCFGAGTADECPAVYDHDHDLKRVVVAVLPGSIVSGQAQPSVRGNKAPATVWMSSLIADPSEAAAASEECVGDCGPPPNGAPRQSFYMTDVSCQETDIYNPYDTTAFPLANHDLHRTSDWEQDGWSNGKGVAACRNAPNPTGWVDGPNNSCYNGTQLCKPDLLSISHPLEPDCESNPSACADDPLARYSTDLYETKPAGQPVSVYGYGPFSRPVQRAPGCTYSAQPGADTSWATDPVNNSMVHTWATNKFEANDFVNTNTQGFNIIGRVSLDFYLGLFGSTVTGDNGRACITLIDRDEKTGNVDPSAADKIIFEFTCGSNQWPIGQPKVFGSGLPLSDYRAGKRLRVRQRCSFSPIVGQKNTFRSPSDPAYAKVEPFPAGGYKIAHGHRLLLRVAADSNGSQHPLVFYYGNPVVPSSINISTDASSELIEDHLR